MFDDKKVAIALVGNFRYLRKNFDRLFNQLRGVGEYKGEIILITTYFCPTFLINNLSKKNNIKIFRFRQIKFNKKTEYLLNNLNTGIEPNRNKTKKFQWHKVHIFDNKFKEWDYIFYLDLNIHIHHSLQPLFKIYPNRNIYARSDSYPDYERTLESQFDTTNFLYKELKSEFDTNINNYFQTCILYFDTNIINEYSKSEIIDLVNKYPISITNEQGIMNLYFIFKEENYIELPLKMDGYITFYYWLLENEKVILSKQNRTQYK